MLQRLVFLLLFLVACGDDPALVLDAPVAVDATPIDPRFASLASVIEAERVSSRAPGVAVALVENGELVWSAGFGTQGPQRDDQPVRATTLFRIGSVNKMLTAAAVMQLVARGEVTLDAPITTYLPDFQVSGEPGAAAITVRHLLTHTHGMLDYLAIDTGADDALLRSFLHSPFWANNMYLMAPPGRLWNYSNPGYYVAGLLVENETALPYREAMRQHLFAPLAMERTFFLGSEVLADGDYANGATVNWETGNGPRAATPDAYDNAWARPAGYAWSSVEDLARFADFLLDGNASVLPDAQRAEMQREQVDTQVLGDVIHYGFGLDVERGVMLPNGDYRAETIVGHGGDIPGFAATVVTVPRTRFAIVVLANTDGAHFPRSVAHALANFAGLPAPTTPPDVTEQPANLDRYAGSYLDPNNAGRVLVTRTGNTLSVSMPDLDAANIPYSPMLTSVSEQNFVLRIQGFNVLVTFILDAQGNGEYFRTRFFVAGRTAAPTQARVMPKLSLEALKRAEVELQRDRLGR